jgi:hypothetical protein
MTSETNSFLFFSGIDFEFLDFLFFPSKDLKDSFLEKLNESITDAEINIATDKMTVLEKISIAYTDKQQVIPLLSEILNFKMEDNFEMFIGKKKLKNYYTALNLCQFNIIEKIKAKRLEFDFEEDLILKTLTSELQNYARINSLFYLGLAFKMAEKQDKMNFYFKMISTDKYDLSPVTVSNYYKQIAEIFIELNDSFSALNWLNSGLDLNPKLSVKKLIKQLEAIKDI